MRRLPTAESRYQIQTQTHTNPSPDFLPAARRTRKDFFTRRSAPESQKSGGNTGSNPVGDAT
ncbi:MAG TPA: hypothetical protein VK638_56115 [Edaphobacter sp.]|nr:hypothetical protein [Edaphobacter sp.]